MSDRDDAEAPRSQESSPPVKLILLLVVVIALAIFFFQNDAEAPIEFLWFDGSWPVWLVIGVSVLIGVVIDRLGTFLWRRGRRSGSE